jgi:hypothetical protein
MATVAVVLLCHADYLPLVHEAVDSINGQQGAEWAQKFLVLDGCDYNPGSGWEVIRGEWGNPNPGRNAALDQLNTDWVVYWDADNVMVDNYLTTGLRAIDGLDHSVGFLYPTLNYVNTNHTTNRIIVPPAWDRYDSRARACYDTSSFWRVTALASVRWNENQHRFDDWSVVHRLSAQGWRGQKLLNWANMRMHQVAPRRSMNNSNNRDSDSLWQFQSFAFCTLFSRPALMDEYFSALRMIDKPQNRSFHALINTPEIANEYIVKRAGDAGFDDVTVKRVGGCPSERFSDDRSARLCDMTNRLLVNTTEDFLVTIDDDCIATRGDTLTQLHRQIKPRGGYGAAGAGYTSRRSPGNIVASSSSTRWVPVGEGYSGDVQAVGNGWTLWWRPAIQHAFPLVGNGYGPDWELSRATLKQGYKIHVQNLGVDHREA